MSKLEKLLQKILSGTADKNIRFDELRNILLTLGFSERVKGSHFIFTKEGVEEIINIQATKDKKAKPYQVKQVRLLITQYKLLIKIIGDGD